MTDPDVNVRHAAAASLGQVGAAEAVGPLIDVLRTEPWLQYPAIHALGEIGDARAEAPLLELLIAGKVEAPVYPPEVLERLAEPLEMPRVGRSAWLPASVAAWPRVFGRRSSSLSRLRTARPPHLCQAIAWSWRRSPTSP